MFGIAMIRCYRDLEVWKLGMQISVECYRITLGFPKDELFGLNSQIRRAAAAIPANIAEGQGRGRTKKFLYFLAIARGSLTELETQLELAQQVELLDIVVKNGVFLKTQTLGRMLTALTKTLRTRIAGGPR